MCFNFSGKSAGNESQQIRPHGGLRYVDKHRMGSCLPEGNSIPNETRKIVIVRVPITGSERGGETPDGFARGSRCNVEASASRTSPEESLSAISVNLSNRTSSSEKSGEAERTRCG